jgi:hypothetical protein
MDSQQHRLFFFYAFGVVRLMLSAYIGAATATGCCSVLNYELSMLNF